MNIEQAAELSERFLRAYIAEHFPPPTTDTPDGFRVALRSVERAGDAALTLTFETDATITLSDRRAPERINHCLDALHAAYPELRHIRFDITLVDSTAE